MAKKQMLSVADCMSLSREKTVPYAAVVEAERALSLMLECKRDWFAMADKDEKKKILKKDADFLNYLSLFEEVVVNSQVTTPFTELQEIADDYEVYSYLKGKQLVDGGRIMAALKERGQSYLSGGFVKGAEPQFVVSGDNFVVADVAKEKIAAIKSPNPATLLARRRDGEMTVLRKADVPNLDDGEDAKPVSMSKEDHAKAAKQIDENKKPQPKAKVIDPHKGQTELSDADLAAQLAAQLAALRAENAALKAEQSDTVH